MGRQPLRPATRSPAEGRTWRQSTDRATRRSPDPRRDRLLSPSARWPEAASPGAPSSASRRRAAPDTRSRAQPSRRGPRLDRHTRCGGSPRWASPDLPSDRCPAAGRWVGSHPHRAPARAPGRTRSLPSRCTTLWSPGRATAASTGRTPRVNRWGCRWVARPVAVKSPA